MKIKKIFIVGFIASIIIYAFSGCKDIIQTSLTNKNVTVVVPSNNLHTTSASMTFLWDEVEGATKYHFQMVSPTFSNASKLIADTNISFHRFELTLSPGTYQWRINAFNESSESEYTTYNLYIDSAASLTTSEVVLISPGTNTSTYVTAQQHIIFKWYNTLYNADDYRFEIHSPDWAGALVFPAELRDGDTISYTLDEGTYEWGVQAQNSTSVSLFTKRKLIIDKTAPATPSLTYPLINATIHDSTLTNSMLRFSWQRYTDNGSTIKDSLYVATDSIFSASAIKVMASCIDTSYTYNLTATATYFWKVRSIDDVGNKSAYTATRKFTFNKAVKK